MEPEKANIEESPSGESIEDVEEEDEVVPEADPWWRPSSTGAPSSAISKKDMAELVRAASR